MKIQRHGAVLGLVAASALLLSACGSDNNAPAGGSDTASTARPSAVDCGGKTKLNAEGSSAQKNADRRVRPGLPGRPAPAQTSRTTPPAPVRA